MIIKSKINKKFHLIFQLEIDWAIFYTIYIEFTLYVNGKHKYEDGGKLS